MFSPILNIARIGLACIILAGILINVSSCGKKESKTEAFSMAQSVPYDIDGWEAQSDTASYDRETIFDYIDGAGEVYLSYDFRKVFVTRFVNPENPEITVEIFDMGNAEDAYGVFSHSREKEEPGIGQGYEYRGSLLSFWKGQYFVCVRAEKETPESKEAVFKLARDIDEKMPALGDKPEMVGFLPPENLSPGSVRFFHNFPTLNYHYFLAEKNLLLLNDSTDAVLGRYEPGGVHLLCIQYPDSELARKGYDSFIDGYIPEGEKTGAGRVENGKWVVADVFANYAIMVFDVKHEMAGRTLLEACKGYLLSSTE